MKAQAKVHTRRMAWNACQDVYKRQIQEDVTIQATSIFGGCDVWVPAGVKVKLSNTPIFGGAENKTNTVPAPDAPTIYINGFTLFGGLEVK